MFTFWLTKKIYEKQSLAFKTALMYFADYVSTDIAADVATTRHQSRNRSNRRPEGWSNTCTIIPYLPYALPLSPIPFPVMRDDKADRLTPHYTFRHYVGFSLLQADHSPGNQRAMFTPPNPSMHASWQQLGPNRDART